MYVTHFEHGICWFYCENLLMTNKKQRNYYGEIKPLCACARCKHMEMNNDSVFKVYGKFIGICLYECECSVCYFFRFFFFIIILFYCSLYSTFAYVMWSIHTHTQISTIYIMHATLFTFVATEIVIYYW